MEASNSAAITWSDASQLREAIGRFEGLAYVEALRDGRLPLDPFAAAVGLRLVEVEHGAVVCEATVQPWQINAGSVAHGGFLSTLMDQSCGLALHTTLAPGRSYPHVGAAYRFLRPTRVGAVLTCRGEVVNAGRTFGVTRCEVHDEEGRLVATGDATNEITLVDGPVSA